jgi:homoserine O-acetyltransferase
MSRMRVAPQRQSFSAPLELTSGATLPEFTIAYESYGRLNADASNAILVCHGLTGDAHAAGRRNAADPKPGWWDAVIGPGRMLDTGEYFVVCSNVLGGCDGSTGPASIDPGSGRPYGASFPVLTIADMVAAQRRLIDDLGISRLHAVIGGCMGGFQVYEWARTYPERVGRAIAISATAQTSAHTLALWRVLRNAIVDDPSYNGGDYYRSGAPLAGMARGMAMATLIWMDRAMWEDKFGRALADREAYSYSLATDFAAERFLEQVEASVSARFDPNSLLFLTRAMDYFDLERGYPDLSAALAAVSCEVLLISYRRDWRYPPADVDLVRRALTANGGDVEHCILNSRVGHGAFIYDPASLVPVVQRFLTTPRFLRAIL